MLKMSSNYHLRPLEEILESSCNPTFNVSTNVVKNVIIYGFLLFSVTIKHYDSASTVEHGF